MPFGSKPPQLVYNHCALQRMFLVRYRGLYAGQYWEVEITLQPDQKYKLDMPPINCWVWDHGLWHIAYGYMQ